MKFNRRSFLSKSGMFTATTTLLSHFPYILKSGFMKTPPSEQINVGLIGCRNRGFHVLLDHLRTGMVNCVALCDIDQRVLNEKEETLKNEYGQKIFRYSDFRLMLERNDIDAVIIGTPDHWHCLQTVYACQSGKDVYVEKPLANSIAECQAIEAAATKFNRIVQVGQQQRSARLWNEVMDYCKSGKLGHIRKANIWGNFNYGLGPVKRPDEPVPEGVDWDMFLGPAPLKPFNVSRFHGSWRHFWDYGGGLMTDWGVHLIDMALWVKDIMDPPPFVLSYGSRLDRPDLAKETFDNMSVIFPYEDYTIEWESNAGKQVGPYDRNYGIAFLGEKGTLVADRNAWQVLPEWDDRLKTHKTNQLNSVHYIEGTQDHVKNFLNCIKSRQVPNCPAGIGSNVALCTHMANIAVRTRDYKLNWDNQKNRFINSEAANQLIKPEYRVPWEFPKS